VLYLVPRSGGADLRLVGGYLELHGIEPLALVDHRLAANWNQLSESADKVNNLFNNFSSYF
jgi:hypothetical protein